MKTLTNENFFVVAESKRIAFAKIKNKKNKDGSRQ